MTRKTALICFALLLSRGALADPPASEFPGMPECGSAEDAQRKGTYCSQRNPANAAPLLPEPAPPSSVPPSPKPVPSPEPPQGVYEDEKPSKTPMPFLYFGLGGEGEAHVSSLGEMDRVRSAQLAAFPLNYSEPIRDFPQGSGSSFSLQVGVRVNDWLDVELATHGSEANYSIFSETDLEDAPPIHRATATQYTDWEELTFSLSILPRWEYNAYFGVIGRLGVGYSSNKLNSSLETSGYGAPVRTCNTDPTTKVETCRDVSSVEKTQLSDIDVKSSGFVPVASIGVQVLQFTRLEYIYRWNVPIGDTTTNISGLFLSFSFKSDLVEKLK